ncbi:Transmembrane protease serine 9, partial [Trachymyrmex septentrionalis]
LSNQENRIVGGRPTLPNRYPWIARLVYDGRFHCGASLLNNDYVITAAHCVRNLKRSKIRVVLGDYDQYVNTDGTPVMRAVSAVVRHRNFDMNSYNHDVALLKLRKSVKFSKKIRPICLPQPGTDPAGKEGTVVGWGRTSEGGMLPGKVQEVQVPIYSLTQCRKMKYRANRITENMICAGRNNQDSCQGDSGGPLLVQEADKLEIAGIVSWGVGCGRPGYPGVYTRVTRYLKWIHANMKEGLYDYRCNKLLNQVAEYEAFVFLNFIIHFVFSDKKVSGCGLRNEESRIVGGQTTSMNEFPWMARLSYLNKFYCGGTLINDRYVLTAAHCVKGFMWFMIRVTFGEHDRCIEKSPETRYVVRVMTGDFSFLNFENDIALLRLNERVPLSDTIRPICLPTMLENEYVEAKAIVSGWGTLKEDGKPSCLLQEVEVPVMSLQACRNTSYSARMISENMLCAGYLEGQKDSCQGDSGGPLITEREDKKYELIGVVSWGNGCARPGYPVCGRPNRKTARLLGGEHTESHEFPWLANIHIKSKLLVSGVLINDRYILTAASQLIGATAHEIKASLGEYDRCNLDISSVNISVESIILHPEFNLESSTHDLALIRLSRPTKIEKRISPICLPNPGSTYLGQVGTLVGWTKHKDQADNAACRPRKLGLPILGQNECIKSGINAMNLQDDYGCIGIVGTNSLVCENDVGSSVQYRSYAGIYDLIGITTSGLLCADVNYPDFYTDVTQMISWILQVTKYDSKYCSTRAKASFTSTSKSRLRNFFITECGLTGGISNRIVGGKITIPHIFPWVVAILNKDNLHCGGTLINNQYILTAGHCVQWTNHADLSVGIGMHDIENPNDGYIVAIDEIILHEDFESDYLHDTNDIALIRLQQPVKIDENVRPACLPHKDSDYTGRNVKVTGWGRVQIEGEPSRFLRQATLKIMSFAACKNTSFGDHVTESMMCAYNDNTDACQGDSGGPLLYQRIDGKYEVLGIVSWGIGCAVPGTPGVYVKNSDYLNWIKYHSRDGIFCMDR